ncbi:MAG TPA: hypothetical protein PK079_04520 [Leptospiraceae bacterium]|nr:hypothetical protein [Leptospiraceae bacterium]HMW04921.1 hypothetical protein [Leptospiraceae bacterium]HMX31930.1 hypothetical protein [Leptospiraceae bacterium]HMY30858.1 hypothetical protein [Leptospiraceae bacterium]HMZ62662.1 hypothetical protein [Leptospiraceae bacterium]
MLSRYNIHADVKDFFDRKNQLVTEIENYERKIYSEKDDLDKIDKLFKQLQVLVEKTNSEYFRLRLVTLDKLLKRVHEKRTYRKIEFDRIFKTLEKIKEDDSIEFLNEGIRNRIEKISERIVRSSQKLDIEFGERFFLLTYKSLSFLVKEYEKKVLQDVDATKTFIRIKNKRYPLFPAYTGLKTDGKETKLDYCNILILKTKNDYKCFRFDQMEIITDLTYDFLQAKLIELPEPVQEIKQYIRLRGKRVYYLDI